MSLFRNVDNEFKQYAVSRRLPDIYEALLCGLAVMRPDEPYTFIAQKLRYLQENGLDCLQWDLFIDDSMKPPARPLGNSKMLEMFDMDELDGPMAVLYEKAYNHCNHSLMRLGLRSLVKFRLLKQMKRSEIERKTHLASRHHTLWNYRSAFKKWQQWVQFRLGRQAVASSEIQHVYHVAISRMVFNAWHSVAQTAQKTREYFERLERGDEMEEDDLIGDGMGEARDDISVLPNTTAVKIFSYINVYDLSRCAHVCRAWKMLTGSTPLLSRLDMTSVRHRLTDRIASRLVTKCRPYLVHANFRDCDCISIDTFSTLAGCRNLQDLNLSSVAGLTDDAVRMLTEGCKILLYLNLSDNSITDASLRYISANLANLQYLSLKKCKRFTDKGLGYLSTGKVSSHLIHIDLSACDQITTQGFEFMSEGLVELLHLVLNDLPNLSDEEIEIVASGCTKLQTVSFLGTPNLSDESFKKLAQHKTLQQVKVDSNKKITDQTLKALGHCTNLRHLYMIDCPNVTDSGLKSLMMCNLVVLNLADCIRIGDAGVRYLTEGTSIMKLQELNLTNCLRVGDAAVVNLLKRGRNLSYLSLCYCDQISDVGLELIGQIQNLSSVDLTGCNLSDQSLSALGCNTRLRDVNISKCGEITDLGLQKFAQQCVWTERLNISHCPLVTDAAIKTLAFCCRLLMYFNVAGCRLLSDLSMHYLSGVCHHMNYIDVSACPHITDKSLKYLKEGCRELQTLVLLYCKGISRQGVLKISRVVPNVQYTDEPMPIGFLL